MRKQTQTTMFPQFAEQRLVTTLARRSDPETSKDAAQRAVENGTIGRNEMRALEAVRRYPLRTGYELDQLCGAESREISKRLAGLANKNLIRRDGKRICTIKKTQCQTWRASE